MFSLAYIFLKRRRIYRNFIEKSMWKQRGFFDHRSYIEKSTWKQRGFFDHRITSKKVPENNVDF